MTDISSTDCQVRLRNSSGVPIVEVLGEMNQATIRSVESMFAALERAGHYNIVLDIRQAISDHLEILSSLAKTAGRIREHYGNIDLVAEANQIRQMANDGVSRIFRICTSELQAIGRIKRLLRPDRAAVETSARIMESEWQTEKQN